LSGLRQMRSNKDVDEGGRKAAPDKKGLGTIAKDRPKHTTINTSRQQRGPDVPPTEEGRAPKMC